ncbi:MAG: 1-deoxy-D-xylulose-5-phosphate reductoisomerase, partial [Clostridia bacterium]|nr:1-deoxy-D-xylulose-5-phosphate reductoisomerase [Clostridia bacterium]
MSLGKKIMILGSTGSVGRQAADVALRSGYRVTALSARNSVRALEEQIRLLRPDKAAMTDEAAAADLADRVADLPVRIYSGEEGLCEMIAGGGADVALNAVIGSAGLRPTLAVIDSGMRLALANKESLVMAGRTVMSRAALRGCEVIPVDSEHSAIFQCLEAGGRSFAEELIITASGGPFRGRKRGELKGVTAAQALAHPTWKMGPSITVDSATLMNKGFEMIEAARLFGFARKDISVLVHPQSVVHSLVRFRDNSVLSQLSVPDMRLWVQ